MRGLTVRGSGRDLEQMDSGVFVEKSAAGAVVEDNRLEGNSTASTCTAPPTRSSRHNEIIGIARRAA